MIIQLFLINLKTAIQQKKKNFHTPYNKEVMKVIPELIKLNLIYNIKKNPINKNNYLIVHLPVNLITNKSLILKNMCSRKKKRTWTNTIIKKLSQRQQTFLLKTNFGYQTSHFCIKKNIGGTTVLQIKY